MKKAEFLEICSQHWEDLQNLHRHDNLYDFEKDFEHLAREFARKSFEGLLDKVPMDYRKKNLHDLLRESLDRQSKCIVQVLEGLQTYTVAQVKSSGSLYQPYFIDGWYVDFRQRVHSPDQGG